MHCHLLRRTIPLLGLLLVCHCVSRSWAVDLVRLTPANYDRFAPEGKEVDAIYGDWVLRNDRIVAVIAAPVAGRNANMTVRGVGGMLIDMTTWDAPSDQLSCFYPAGGRYLFTDASQGAVVRDGGSPLALDGDHLGASEIRVSVTGNAINQDGTTATVTYTLRNGQDWIDYEVTIHNPAESPVELPIEDMLRCDGNLFRTGTLEDNQVFFAEDRYFGQCYGIQNFAGPIAKLGGRNMQLRPRENPLRKVTAAQPLQWQGVIACSQGLPGIRQWATSRRTQTGPRQLVVLNISDILGPVDHAVVELWQDGRSLGTVQSNDAGRVALRLLPDRYRVQVRSHGVADAEFSVDVGDRSIERTLELPEPSRVAVEITDGDGRPIPAKVQFIGIDGTTSPDFGPDSAISAIKNAVYTAHGQFTQRIDPGTYRVIASHGPEYDAATMTIEVAAGQQASVRARLPRVVDTSGWVSADFHSHSSPSGDNVSHQTGRVLNLLAEHIEFAPCTEHNRIDTYVDNLQELGATQLMATCSGMELTGNPLPINHQNAFPLKMHLHHQDGGGPQTDADPVKQIERLALWD
ncbi:MAG: carboxypeptidase regulatory-like domain-containing protein, partial [Planctomycetota bacterium]